MSGPVVRQRLVIVGNGMVCHRLCERLVGADATRYEITIFAEENRPAYDRVNLGEVLRGRDSSSLALATNEWYRTHDIALHLGDPVVCLDLPAKKVRSARGLEHPYDKLVLATGSVPVLPPIRIDDWSNVSVLRTLEDVERVRAGAALARRAVVIGGGPLGLETAAGLRAAGLEVTVVQRSTQLLNPYLDPGTARMLKTALEGDGIGVRLETTAISIVGDQTGKLVTLIDGSVLDADLVVIACGARPRDNLAAWGLASHPRGGFVVNERLETSDRDIYAIGECAIVGEAPIGTVSPGYVMAECLADTLLGRPRPFHPPPPSIRVKIANLPVAITGEMPTSDSEKAETGNPRLQRTIEVKNGRLVGAAAVGEWREWERVEDAVRRRRRLPHWRIERFQRGDPMWPDEPSTKGLPEDTVVCSCNGVTYGRVQEAIAGGCRTAAEVATRTRAGTTCGGCAPMLERLVAVGLPPTAARSPAMVVLGLVALTTVAVVAGARPLLERVWPASLPRWDHLLRAPWEQQLTGFVMLGLIAAALLFPLARKVGASVASVQVWRVVHALVGGLAVAAMLAHTGLRLGVNLNLFLSIAFLGLAAIGGVASLALASRRGLPVGWPRVARVLHLALFWPTLALVGLHVLAVYYF
jgi:nitrite reductase (NADH) large subunit